MAHRHASDRPRTGGHRCSRGHPRGRRRRRDRHRRRRPAWLLLPARSCLLTWPTKCRRSGSGRLRPPSSPACASRSSASASPPSIPAATGSPSRAAASSGTTACSWPPAPRRSRPGCPAPSWTEWSSWTTSTTRATSSAGAPTAKAAVVVGGGITALEIVEGLHAHSVHVDYFMRRTATGATCCRRPSRRPSTSNCARTASGPHLHRTRRHPRPGRPGGRRGDRRGQAHRLRPRGRGDRRTAAHRARAGGRARLRRAASWSTTTCDPAPSTCTRRATSRKPRATSDRPAHVGGAVEHGRDKGRTAGLNMATRGPGRRGPYATHRRAPQRHEAGRPAHDHHRHRRQRQRSDLEGLSRGDSDTWSELGESVIVETQVAGARVRLALGERI